MLSPREEIRHGLKAALKGLGIGEIEITVEHPSDPSHGDYSSNIALVAAKKLGKNPMELAEKIRKKLLATGEPGARSQEPGAIEKIEVAKPGFINFWLSKTYLSTHLSKLLVSDRTIPTGNLAYRGQKILVEFTDPNPFKEFHIGHLYSNTVGEAICRLLEANGAIIRRVNYQGDVGLHVAKSLWGIIQMLKASKQKLEVVEEKSLEEKVRFLGLAYARGTKAYEEDEEAKKEINELNKKVYDRDPSIKEIYEKGREWSLAYFEEIYKRLGTKFDFYYFESEVGKIGLDLVKGHVKKPFGSAQGKGVFEESEGAIIFPGKKFGLHNRVFINSLGLPTYEAKELGLAPKKYEDFPYDLSIIVTGNEIIEYFRLLLKALEQIRPDLASKTRHLPHGMVRLPTGKMSSRTGDIITGQWLLDVAAEQIQKAYPEIDEAVAEIVAVGAIKYALLKSSIGKDIAFDFRESISLEGNSGPYLQYTYARTQSVLGKGQRAKGKGQRNSLLSALRPTLQPEELSLMRSLHRFPEIIEEATANFAPNLLCSYLFDLAQKFNLFYQKHKILSPHVILVSEAHPGSDGDSGQSQNDVQSQFRLALTAGVGKTLKQGLYLLGIAAPERM